MFYALCLVAFVVKWGFGFSLMVVSLVYILVNEKASDSRWMRTSLADKK